MYAGEELLLFLLTILSLLDPNECISCYVCQSMNNENPDCDDPFFTNRTDTFLQMPCMTGRKERNGQFPGTACIKLSGLYENGDTLTIRTCALDSGSLTIDTELVRMSHCGSIIFGDAYVRGCLQSCSTDGCNGARAAIPAGARSPHAAVLAAAAVLCIAHLAGAAAAPIYS